MRVMSLLRLARIDEKLTRHDHFLTASSPLRISSAPAAFDTDLDIDRHKSAFVLCHETTVRRFRLNHRSVGTKSISLRAAGARLTVANMARH